MSNKATSRPQKVTSTVVDSQTFQMSRHPAFVAAVNRAANLKLAEAIKSGKLCIASQPSRPAAATNATNPVRYAPRTDLVDDPSSSKLTAIFELPGIQTNQLSLQIRDGLLVIAGERKAPHLTSSLRHPALAAKEVTSSDMDTDDVQPGRHIQYPIQELRYGHFFRSIRIPDGIRESDVQATLQDGMLTVSWPRSPLARSESAYKADGAKPSPPAHAATAGIALQ